MNELTYFVTGASGQLGRIAVSLLASRKLRVVAGARNPQKLEDLAALGVEVRLCDYDKPDTVFQALEGVDRLLLVSSSEVGKRVAQHRTVIHAAHAREISLVVYTSILQAATSPLLLASEHKATEEILAEAGMSHVLLRNAWYSENFQMGVPTALEHGAVYTAAGDGRFSPATRQELAEGAVAALTAAATQPETIYELAGSASFSMPELAATLSLRSGRKVDCVNMAEGDYAAMLKNVGVPAGFADILAQSEVMAEQGAHSDESRALERLIGRAPLSLSELVDQWITPIN
ncbi:MAG: SDR family oxidoreductase [Sphingorhabdus sp.]